MIQLAGLIGVMFVCELGYMKTTVQTLILYGALTGLIGTGLSHMAAYHQEEKSSTYELVLLGCYGLLNLIAAYFLFQKFDFGCGCTIKGAIPVFGACAVGGGCMLTDLVIQKAGKGE